MKAKCPYHSLLVSPASQSRISSLRKAGYFYRQSDRKKVQRFYCKICHLHFSAATFSKCFGQKKRQLNHKVAHLLSIGVSQREGHKFLKINRKTLVRKFIFMGLNAEKKLLGLNQQKPQALSIQFDDLETFEHTKCKPLSVTLAVEERTRRILGFEVSRMPAKGSISKIALKKYGYRKDERSEGRERLFLKIKPLVCERSIIRSDKNPHYAGDVQKHFPKAMYIQHKGKRGAITGQGELKKIGFDPLFSLNHTCAIYRARANRLFRRTWCTTKKPEMLKLHLAIVSLHHNQRLKNAG